MKFNFNNLKDLSLVQDGHLKLFGPVAVVRHKIQRIIR